MNGNSASNVTQVLNAYQKFLNIYGNPLWAKVVDVEDIKSSFKLGNYIEKSTHAFKMKGFLKQFLSLFEIWAQKNSVHVNEECNEDFFVHANDHLLQKLFKFPNAKESTLDIAVRVYTSLYPKERFKACIKSLLKDQASLKTIADYVINSISDSTAIENQCILHKWSEYYKAGLEKDLKSEIESYLSLYNVKEKLSMLLSLLSTKDMTNEASEVKNVVLECILNKMVDRSVLSNSFWLTLLKKVDSKCVIRVCCNFPSFFDSLLNFVEYIGSMMVKKDSDNDFFEWTCNHNVLFCSELTYFELVIFLKFICTENDLKLILIDRIDQVKSYSTSDIWDHILNDICD